LFVEFEIARSSKGLQRADWLRNFQSLRMRYQDCANRDTEWFTAVESVGASVLYNEVELLMDTSWDQRGLDLTIRETATMLRDKHPSASVCVLCSEAMPLRDLREECVTQLQRSIRATGPDRDGCRH
jgi:hypothetical protein